MARVSPALLVGIDTEGDNQWDAAARRRQTFENIYALDRLHDFFARLGVRPTYLVTYPVARDARSADTLRRLAGRGDCEIGAHHHAWETPPCEPADVDRHPYALSLPLTRFDEQLASLTKAIDEAVGRRPTSYRSGPVRVLGGARVITRTAGIRSGVERGAAALRSAQGADRISWTPRSRRTFLSYDDAPGQGRARCSSCLSRPRSTAACRRGSNGATGGCRGRTRRNA